MTKLASTDVLAHKLILAGSVKVATYGKVSIFSTTMTTCWGFVTFIHDEQAQGVMSRNDDRRRVAGTAVYYSDPLRVVFRSDEERYKADESFNDLRVGFIR